MRKSVDKGSYISGNPRANGSCISGNPGAEGSHPSGNSGAKILQHTVELEMMKQLVLEYKIMEESWHSEKLI